MKLFEAIKEAIRDCEVNYNADKDNHDEIYQALALVEQLEGEINKQLNSITSDMYEAGIVDSLTNILNLEAKEQ